MAEDMETGGAHHEIDDETGRPYWRLWGAGWKDEDRMDCNEVMKLDPRSFPPGTRIIVIEPDMDDPRSSEFYERLAEQKKYYPLKGKRLDAVLEQQ